MEMMFQFMPEITKPVNKVAYWCTSESGGRLYMHKFKLCRVCGYIQGILF